MGRLVGVVSGIRSVADGLVDEFKRRLPQQRKTQHTYLALLVATMLEVHSANLMDLAASLPRKTDRTDMLYQWIAHVLGNWLIDPDTVMVPLAVEVLEQAAAEAGGIVLILDQSKLSERHQVLILALRRGERALPLAWRVEATQGAVGFVTQKDLPGSVARSSIEAVEHRIRWTVCGGARRPAAGGRRPSSYRLFQVSRHGPARAIAESSTIRRGELRRPCRHQRSARDASVASESEVRAFASSATAQVM